MPENIWLQSQLAFPYLFDFLCLTGNLGRDPTKDLRGKNTHQPSTSRVDVYKSISIKQMCLQNLNKNTSLSHSATILTEKQPSPRELLVKFA